MKGTLAHFESKVNSTIRTTYKSYIDDFRGVIGYFPQENITSKKKTRQYENDRIEKSSNHVYEPDFEQDL